jgi:hypothetical protein
MTAAVVMSDHVLEYISEDDAEVLFSCTKCQAKIAFPKPSKGEPSPKEKMDPVIADIQIGWEPHADYMKWMDPCLK